LENDGSAAGNTLYTLWKDGLVRADPAQTQLRISDYGLWCEGAKSGTGSVNNTNYCLWARDLTNAVWTATNCTVAKNQTGADGKASLASSLTATSANATVLQTISGIPSTAYIFAAWPKRLSGTGQIFMTLDGSAYTDITSQLNSTSL
jgi:hypothetical protein